MQTYKRQQYRGFEQQPAVPHDPTAEKLQTLGMRIRQSISNGYKLPEQQLQSQIPSYMNNYEQQQVINNNRRVPLPCHLQNSQPPALDYNGSTASSLSCWEEEINDVGNSNRFQNLNNYYTVGGSEKSVNGGLKRGFEQLEGKDMQVSDFVERYGPLSFNEEF